MQSFLTVAGKVDIQSKIFNAFSSVPLKLLPKKVVLMIEMIPVSSYGEWLLTASRSRKQTAKSAPNNTDAICWAMPQIRCFCLKKTIADFNPMVLANGEFGI